MAVKRGQGGPVVGLVSLWDLHIGDVVDDRADFLRSLLAELSSDSQQMNEKLIDVVRLLSSMGEWTAVIRLLVGLGGYNQAELATALGVMRSTIARWFNGETKPAADQVKIYAERLVRFMTPTRALDLRVGNGPFTSRSN